MKVSLPQGATYRPHTEQENLGKRFPHPMCNRSIWLFTWIQVDSVFRFSFRSRHFLLSPSILSLGQGVSFSTTSLHERLVVFSLVMREKKKKKKQMHVSISHSVILRNSLGERGREEGFVCQHTQRHDHFWRKNGSFSRHLNKDRYCRVISATRAGHKAGTLRNAFRPPRVEVTYITQATRRAFFRFRSNSVHTGFPRLLGILHGYTIFSGFCQSKIDNCGVRQH